jgi:ATP-dependent exoDNAse (exonuclease V) beta subunit
VREQHQKDSLPEFLKGMLCLTVFEAKGLEFDDVILFNFFNSNQITTGHWKFINEIQFEKSESGGVDQIVKGLENLL